MMKIELDSIYIPNQSIAKQGSLLYSDGRGLKKIEDLHANIGREVPIVDGHPSRNNAKKGLVVDEKRYGTAIIVACPKNDKRLCANLKLDDDAPDRDGFSIGFTFEKVDEKGELDGFSYDYIQSGLWIDHLALTDYPRDEEELMILGDALSREINTTRKSSRVAGDARIPPEEEKHNGNIIKRVLAHDSYRFQHPRLDEIKRKLQEKQENDTAEADQIHRVACRMFLNEQRLELRKKLKEKQAAASKNKKSDLKMVKKDENENSGWKAQENRSPATDARLLEENTQLREELAALKAKNDTLDATAGVLSDRDSVIAEKDALLAEQDELIDSLEKRIAAYDAKEFTSRLDAVWNRHGLKSEDKKHLAGTGADVLKGMELLSRLISPGNPPMGDELTEEDKQKLANRGGAVAPRQNGDEGGSQAGFRWDDTANNGHGAYVLEHEYDPVQAAIRRDKERRMR